MITPKLHSTQQGGVGMDKSEIIATRWKVLRLALGFHRANKFTEFVGIADNALNYFERARRTPMVKDALKLRGKSASPLIGSLAEIARVCRTR
jgi:hypothetical protein